MCWFRSNLAISLKDGETNRKDRTVFWLTLFALCNVPIPSDQSPGPKASLSTTATITSASKSSLEASPSRGGRKSQTVPPPPQTVAGSTALRPSAFSQCLLSPYLLQPQLERTQLTDVWATALAVSLSTSSALSLHPAMLYTWNTAFQRLTQVFSLIDPKCVSDFV